MLSGQHPGATGFSNMTSAYVLLQWFQPWWLLLPVLAVCALTMIVYVRVTDHLFVMDAPLEGASSSEKGLSMPETTSSHLNAGFVLAAVMILLHSLWALLVALGWGQAVIDFVFWLHMLSSPYKVQNFEASVAVFLILATGTIGFVVGSLASFFWGMLTPDPKRDE
jgi:hypothetical protein